MEHVYKGKAVFGGEHYEIVYGNQTYTHVALENEEYEDLLEYKNACLNIAKELDELKDDYDSLKKEHDKLVESYKKVLDAYNEKAKVLQNSKKSIEEIKQIRAETEAIRQTKQNIIELIRERANKERKLKNKKDDSGYVVKSSQIIQYRCGKNSTVPMWKTTIQTPFFTEFSGKQFHEYFNNDEYREEYFRQIGIGDFCEVSLSNQKDITDNKGKHYIDYYVNKNFSSGFWEITLIHYKEVVL